MSTSRDLASIVIGEQINRMLEQERKSFELTPFPGFGQECPFLSKDQMNQIAEATLYMVVMMKISIMARLN